jgi:hypothetical protein
MKFIPRRNVYEIYSSQNLMMPQYLQYESVAGLMSASDSSFPAKVKDALCVCDIIYVPKLLLWGSICITFL